MQNIKINLEFENLEELNETLKGLSAAIMLLGNDASSRVLGCEHHWRIAEKYTEEEEREYFKKAKELYDTLNAFYKYTKENN